MYGESVTFYATVGTTNGGFGTPSGSVMFYDEATGAESDPITLDTNGCATWTLHRIPDAEDHYIVATYTSDSGTFVGGTVGEFDQTVNPAGTTTDVVSVADTTNPGGRQQSGLWRPDQHHGDCHPVNHGRCDPGPGREQQRRDGRFLRHGYGPVPRPGRP